jgi:folate-binding protein YgfZ
MKQGALYRLHARAGAAFVECEGWSLPSSYGSPEAELAALRETVGLADLRGWGVLRLRGSNRVDFVQRMSTNDVLALTPGQGTPTVFTTPIGRIVDLAFVLVREDDLLLLVSRGADERMAAWLQQHIFFNDDVSVENLTGDQECIGLVGSTVSALMADLVGTDVSELPAYHSATDQVEGADVTILRSVPLGYDYLLISDPEQIPVVWETLLAAVRSFAGRAVGETALEAARISAGRPRYGRELTEDFIPLEAGLKRAVSFNKGCYVGQEIIARMETYQKLAKRLVVLGLQSGMHTADGGPALDSKVSSGEADVGQVTSVAPMADGGMWKALAYVRTKVAHPGRELSVLDRESERWTATVLAVPGQNES